MKNLRLVLCTVVSLLIAGTTVAWGHGGDGHHQEPGYDTGKHDCYLDSDFHNYGHQHDYGTGKNIWCDGIDPQLAPHHGGNPVRAALPANNSFVGGFCIKAGLAGQATVLDVNYKDVVAHDKVWLLDKTDSNYYPIDRAANETSIQIEDNGWADKNPAQGQVEAEVLFSSPNGGGSGSGGGCNSAGAGSWMGAAFFFVVPAFFLRKTR
jgi:hypothetical protein